MSILNLERITNHYDLSDLPGYPESKVILSRKTPTKAVVFVHGFKGKPLDTWTGFDTLAPSAAQFADSDLYFFGYDGVQSNTLAATSFLYELLDTLGTTPGQLSKDLLPPGGSTPRSEYNRIVIAAHSLGAVVSRWTLARAAEQQSPWRSKIKLILFAPAHCGSDLQQTAAAALAGVPYLQTLVTSAPIAVPLLRELEPESRLLRELEIRIKQLIEKGETSLKASRVVIAERELVVSNLPFWGDPFPDALRDTNHITVCKPTNERQQALHYVGELLQ